LSFSPLPDPISLLLRRHLFQHQQMQAAAAP
jgi:hypothetical protein